MTAGLVQLEVQDGVAIVSFNRPEKRNAMSDDMRTEFITVLEHVAANKEIKALVLTGQGAAFCAGGDISGMKKRMEAPAGRLVLMVGLDSNVFTTPFPFYTICQNQPLLLLMALHPVWVQTLL